MIRATTLALAVAIATSMGGCVQNRQATDEKAEYHYKLASNFFYDENTTSAIGELYTSLKFEPRHARAHHLLGFIYFGRQDWKRAQEHLQAAVVIDPEFDDAVANLGNLYLATEEWASAIPYFEKLLERPLYKTPYLAHNNLGWAKYKTGRFEEAQKHITMAIFLNPKFCLGYNNQGRIQAHLGETAKALESFQKAIELCPNYAEPHYFLGRIFAALSAPERAHAHFEKCHSLGPDTPYGRRCREAL